MTKVFIAARSADRERLLDRVRDLSMLHLTPVDPDRAKPDEQTVALIKDIGRALQVLSGVEPEGQAPRISPTEAAHEVLDIQRRAAEHHNRLIALHRQIEQMALWGDVRTEQFEQLREAGLEVRFFSVPSESVGEIDAECVEVVGVLPGKRSLVAVVDRRGEPRLPERATAVPPPARDAPSIRAEASELDAGLKKDARHLAEIAHLAPEIQRRLHELQQQADYTVALRGASEDEKLFAIQGWVPAERVTSLTADLASAGLDAAVQALEPEPDEQPPTQIRYPGWARPIEGLFKILGTVAGYREFDVSIPFMIALPIFAAMLISDGGYGAVLLLGLLLSYRKASKVLGAEFTQLLIVVGAVTLVWGFLCGSFFGCVLYDPPIPVDLSAQSRAMLMKISFVMGAIHLSIAQLWQGAALYPNLRFLNRVGWAVFIWGILGVVRFFVLSAPVGWDTPWPYLLIVGAALAILFASPSRNIAKMLGLGLADFPLSLLSAFSDVISYVRLMAVGLASSVLASNFNELALGMGFWPLVVVVLLFGHSLNLGLALIALFAHGVRLNMLEFSNNLGMQWTGYPYNPFLKQTIQEH